MVTYSISKNKADRKAIGYYLAHAVNVVTTRGPDLEIDSKLAAVKDARWTALSGSF